MKPLLQLVLLPMLLAWCAPVQATTTISRTSGGCAAATTSCTLGTHQAGDVFFAFASRDGSNTAPTLPSGWTNIDNNGANTASYRMGCKIALSSSETSGTWTNATQLIVVGYRGVLLSGDCATGTVGGQATEATGNSATLTYNSITFTDSGGTSWGFICGFSESATDVEGGPGGSMVNITSIGTEAACFDTNGTATTYAGGTDGVNASNGWHTKGFEIRACTTTICLASYTSALADASSTTIAAAAVTHTAGNLLVAFCNGSGSNTVSSVTDTASNTYTQATSAYVTAAAGFADTWYASNISGNSSNAVTCTFNTGTTFRRIIVLEYSGADTSSPFEVAATGSCSACTTVTSGSFSPAASGNVNAAFTGTSNVVTTWTPGANYRMERLLSDAGTEDRPGAPSGSQTVGQTINTSLNMVMTLGSFKPPSGGGGGATPPPTLMMQGVGD